MAILKFSQMHVASSLIRVQFCLPGVILPGSRLHSLGTYFCTLSHSSSSIKGRLYLYMDSFLTARDSLEIQRLTLILYNLSLLFIIIIF